MPLTPSLSIMQAVKVMVENSIVFKGYGRNLKYDVEGEVQRKGIICDINLIRAATSGRRPTDSPVVNFLFASFNLLARC